MKYFTVNENKGYSSSLDVMTSESYYSLTDPKVNIRQILAFIDEATAESVISEYIGADDVKGLVNVKELSSLILWLKYVVELKVTDVSLFEDPPFIEIDIDGCGWEEWGVIAKDVKGELINEGLGDLAEKVALVCPKALKG